VQKPDLKIQKGDKGRDAGINQSVLFVVTLCLTPLVLVALMVSKSQIIS
jgi:hypothetical protein